MVVFNTSSENYTIISPSFTNHHNLITLSTRVSKNKVWMNNYITFKPNKNTSEVFCIYSSFV